jgi:hypothetical protein
VCGCVQGLPVAQREPTASSTKGVTVQEVVGSYYFGDGLGVNCLLKLRPNQTFTFSWTGCLGEYDKNDGPFVREGDLVVLKPTKPNRREGFEGTATRLYPVRWADRLYLIAEEQMLGFCARVQAGWNGEEPGGRSGFYYLRNPLKDGERGKLKNLKGRPEVPESYKRYLKEPFTALVSKKTGQSTVLVNKGSSEGIVAGTKLMSKDGTWLSVKAVREHECECEIWMKGDKTPKVGAKLVPVEV